MTEKVERHFLLSQEAKALKPMSASILKLDEAYERFKDVRWGWQDGRPSCPNCGHERVYEYSSRSKFKCAKCGRQFSVTTKTIFHAHKLPYSTILHATALRLHDPKGGLQASYDLGVTPKTSYDLLHRLCPIVGNIQPRVIETRWPYINADGSEENELLLRVSEAVPRGLPEQVRADVGQDIVLGVLEGSIHEDNLLSEVQHYVKRHYRSFEWNKWNTLSLNQPVPGTDSRPWDDVLSSEVEHV